MLYVEPFEVGRVVEEPSVCWKLQSHVLEPEEGFGHREHIQKLARVYPEHHYAQPASYHHAKVPMCLRLSEERRLAHEHVVSVPLIFSIPTLHLLMCSLLYFTFQNPRPSGLVEVCDFQDMCCIDPVIRAPAHDMVTSNVVLVYWNL